LAIVGLADELADERDVRQFLVLGKRELQDDLELAAVEVGLVARARDAPGIADDAVKLATLDREHDLLRARIAGNRLELGAEERIERGREDVLIAAGASRSDLQRGAREHLLQGRGRAGLADVEARHL